MGIKKGTRNPSKVSVARRFRPEMGQTEVRVWELLRDRRTGFKFRRQVPILGYVLDFYCAESCVAVEVDGPHHEGRRDLDAVRDERLLEIGVLTVRVPTGVFWEENCAEGTRFMKHLVELCEERA